MEYKTWKGETRTLSHFTYGKGRYAWTESCVSRTVELPEWLIDKFEEQMYQPGWQNRTAHERNSWIHLMDAVNCETVSISESLECLEAGRVFENLLSRASNYMHTVN
jgi:hypothetical protein